MNGSRPTTATYYSSSAHPGAETRSVGTPRRPAGDGALTERSTPHAPSIADSIADARSRSRWIVHGAAFERSTSTFSSQRSSGTRRETPPALNPSGRMQFQRALTAESRRCERSSTSTRKGPVYRRTVQHTLARGLNLGADQRECRLCVCEACAHAGLSAFCGIQVGERRPWCDPGGLEDIALGLGGARGLFDAAQLAASAPPAVRAVRRSVSCSPEITISGVAP